MDLSGFEGVLNPSSSLSFLFFQFPEIGGIWRGRDSKFRTLFGDFHFYP